MNSIAREVLKIEEVIGTPPQITFLYELLESRDHSISHQSMPTFEQHRNFVLSKPYQNWYLVFNGDQAVGSFYIQTDNSVGLNLNCAKKEWVNTILAFLSNNSYPNSEISSKIPPYFYINVPYKDKALAKILEKMGHVPIQTSYKIVNL